MKPGHKKTTIDIPDRIYLELRCAAELTGRTMSDIVTEGLAERVEFINDDHDKAYSSEADDLLKKVYKMRKDEAYQSEVQRETLRKLREG